MEGADSQYFEDPYHDDVGKALQAFLHAKTKKENHFAMSSLRTYTELTTQCV